MRKFLMGGAVAALLLMGGIGAVWASEVVTPKVPDEKTFEEMLPFMKKMHPGVSDETFKEMFNSCHANGGSGGMMGNGGHAGMMGNGTTPNMMKGL